MFFLATILRKRYIIQNVRRRRNSREYASIILRAAKSIELNFIINQIAVIYNKINVESQRNIIRFANIASLIVFFTKSERFQAYLMIINREK